MKIRHLFATLMAVTITALTAQALHKTYLSPYLSEWHKADEQCKDNLPRSAVKSLDGIIALAKRDGNVLESLRAIDQKMVMLKSIDRQLALQYMDTLINLGANYKGEMNQALYNYIVVKNISNLQPNSYAASNELDYSKPYSQWSTTTAIDYARSLINAIVKWRSELTGEPIGVYSRLLDSKLPYDIQAPNLYAALLNNILANCSDALRYDQPYTAMLYKQAAMACPDDDQMRVYMELERAVLCYNGDPESREATMKSIDSIINTCAQRPVVCYAYLQRINISNPYQSKDPARFTSLDSLCNNLIARFADSKFSEPLKSIKAQLHMPTLDIELDNQIYPNLATPFATLSYRNLTKIKMMAWRIDGADFLARTKLDNLPNDSLALLVNGRRADSSFERKLSSPLYALQRDTLSIKLDREGIYVVSFERNDSASTTQYGTLSVSRIATLTRAETIYVADFVSGKPYGSVDVTLFEQNGGSWICPIYSVIGRHTTTLKGYTPIKYDQKLSSVSIGLSHKDDRYSPLSQIWSNSGRDIQHNQITCDMVTDRSRYQPGDTVRFKAIFVKHTNRGAEPLCGDSITIELLSQRAIASTKLLTDSWGSVNGSFALPKQGLNGALRIKSRYGSKSINVESYKAPTFGLTTTNIPQRNNFNQALTISGAVKRYSGFNTGAIDVSYTIKETSTLPYRYTGMASNKLSASGTLKCNADGSFKIDFTPTESRKSLNAAIYTIEIKATDSRGESQIATEQLLVGRPERYININGLPAIADKNRRLEFNVNSWSWGYIGRDKQGLLGEYTIIDSRGQRLQNSFSTTKPISINISSLASGRCSISCQLDGESASRGYNSSFIIFSPSDRALPVDTTLFVVATTTKATATEPIAFSLGTNQSEIYAQVELLSGDSVLYSKAHRFTNGLHSNTLHYLASYPNKAKLVVSAIRNTRSYIYTQDVERDEHQQQLTMRLITERTAKPGTQQSIAVEVKDQDGRGVEANVTLSIFDISSENRGINTFRTISNYSLTPPNSSTIQGASFQRTNLMRMVVTTGYGRRSPMTRSMIAGSQDYAMNKGNGNSMELDGTASPSPATVGQQSSVLRRDFRQTAAFMPNLITDATTGRVEAKYSLPDALTTYNIEALAYTRSLSSTVARQSIVVSRDVMIVPNTPKFIRLGDQIVIKAEAMNSSSKTITATANLQIFNPSKPGGATICNGIQSKTLTLAPNSTQSIEWRIDSLPELPMVAIRTSLDTPTQCDSEERLIALISPQERLFAGKSIMVNRDSVIIDLRAQLKDGASNEKMVVNTTPALVMLINSLPYTRKANFDCATELADVWYIDAIARRMSSRYSSYLDRNLDAARAIKNPLEAYSEITEIALQETPWLRASVQNRERMEALVGYKDKQTSQDRVREHASRLAKIQNPDGGFSWFPSMPSSPMITAFVLERFGALCQAKYYGYTPKIITHALSYLDREIERLYKADSTAIAKSVYSKDAPLPSHAINYLYVRSMMPDSLSTPRSKELAKLLCQRLEPTAHRASTQEMAMAALILQKEARPIDKIIASLSELATKGPNGGYFFPNAAPQWGMMSNTLRAHALAMKLLLSDERTAELGGEVANWLMLQRHNQQWPNTSAAADVVGLLWSHLINKTIKTTDRPRIYSRYPTINDGTTIAINGNSVDIQALRKMGGVVKVANKSSLPAFVDVIYSYDLPSKAIEQQSNGIKISRQLLRERVVNGKAVLETIDAKTALNIGDIVVVSNTVIAPGDMSFVVVQSKRSGSMLPIDQSSGYHKGSYREVKDSGTNYYFDLLPRGTTTIQERLLVCYQGTFGDGVAKALSLYNPAQSGNSASTTVVVE